MNWRIACAVSQTPIPIISSVVANCSRSAQTLSSQPSTRRPTCAATMPTATSASAKPRLNTRTVTRPSTTRPVDKRGEQDRQRGRIGENSTRDAERDQHGKPWAFAGYEIQAMRMLGAPAVAMPDNPLGIAGQPVRDIAVFVCHVRGHARVVVMHVVVIHGHARDQVTGTVWACAYGVIGAGWYVQHRVMWWSGLT